MSDGRRDGDFSRERKMDGDDYDKQEFTVSSGSG